MDVRQESLTSEINLIVRQHRDSGGVLRTGEAAKKLGSRYPSCGLAAPEIATMLAREAIHQGIPIQFTPAD